VKPPAGSIVHGLSAAEEIGFSMPRRERPPSQRQYIGDRMPALIDFQHPKLVVAPPSGDTWLHEVKFDGYRMQLRVQSGGVSIHTRNAHDWTNRFPEIAAEAAELPDCILDAELCAIGETGEPDFSALRASISPGKTGDLVLYVFDLAWHEREDLRPYALSARKAVLAQLMEAHGSERLRMVTEVPGHGPSLLKAACQMGLEGIVSKRRDAPYRGGRGETWVKAKCRPGQEVVIGGWVQEPGRAFKALLVGVYEGEILRYAGSVKTGFSGSHDMVRQLQALEAKASPFGAGEPPRKTSEIHWVRPDLVANVAFAEWTASGKLRQSSFKGLRTDKEPREVVRET
jgi:bifunctional non-homologous end joining protein LigD